MSSPPHNDDRPPAPWKHALERHQGWLFVPLVAGLVLWPILGPGVGLPVAGASVAAAGMVPVLTGHYLSGPFRLRGIPARLRGLVSVGIGVAVIWFGRSLAG
ncbi:MAG: hypothetical protein EA398_13595 [Deltaproteobacteria bacterium]|nr:MAG: hypothetical protein EA398_13595 [Deltaproteobacteria bacterium]